MPNIQIKDLAQITTRNNDDWLLIQEASTGAYKKIKVSDFIAGLTGTGYTKLSGTAFGTSPSYAAGYEFSKAFDGNTATFFDYASANGGYTGLDLGAGNEAILKKIRFFPRPSYASRMTGGIFQGSNTSNSSGYVDLLTINFTPVQDWNEVIVSSSTAYRYFRYLSPGNSYGNVAEIEFYK